MTGLIATALLVASMTISAADEKKIIYPPEFRDGIPFNSGVQAADTLSRLGQTGSDHVTGEYPKDFEQKVHQAIERFGREARGGPRELGRVSPGHNRTAGCSD